MGDITSGCTIRHGARVSGVTEIIIETAATADTTDTIALTLSDYGVTTFLSIVGNVQTTVNSVIVDEAPTTAVSGGVLTITLTSATDKKRVYVVRGI